MIEIKGNIFNIKTASTSYIMRIGVDSILEHLSYGPRIDSYEGIERIAETSTVNVGTVPYLDEEHQRIFPTNMLLELSTPGRGDNRTASLELWSGMDILMLDFRYVNHRVYSGKDTTFPVGALSEGAETLEIELKDTVLPITVMLRYTVYEDADSIVRSMRIINNTDRSIVIKRASSLLLDLPSAGFTLYSYDGAWAREKKETAHKLETGIITIDSKLGCSGSEHNPLIHLENERGLAYAFNLIYSGNHRSDIEVSPFGKTRVVTGLSDYAFSWKLEKGSFFDTPEAVMTASNRGRGKCAENFQAFTEKYIVRGYWKDKERPILINNWEATYFDFDEDKLLSLADEAASLGIELFVLDDGWFGERTSDSKGLGDWYPNTKRLPSGLKGIAEKINGKGLMFGLWVEPEMVNMDSNLYRAHPDWVIALPDKSPLVCRHQYVLDLSRKEVVDYLYDAMSTVFSSCNLSYVKWDMNRTITDYYSRNEAMHGSGEFLHRYILGLYSLLSRLTAAFPHILFEGCASGGNRFDLGMLAFMPQIWTSDNTDLYDRVSIEEGTLMGYAPSTMGAHVSVSPAHQSLRISRIESRFNIAAFGVLGYELDLTALSEKDKLAVKREVAFYKKHRHIFQFGRFSKLVISQNQRWWYVRKGTSAIALEIQTLNEVHTGRDDRLFLPFAEDGKRYRIEARREILPSWCFGNIKDAPDESEAFCTVVDGTILREYGVALGPQFTGNGFFSETRILGDFGSRMYVIEEIKE